MRAGAALFIIVYNCKVFFIGLHTNFHSTSTNRFSGKVTCFTINFNIIDIIMSIIIKLIKKSTLSIG
jgi:hypothetical protein